MRRCTCRHKIEKKDNEQCYCLRGAHNASDRSGQLLKEIRVSISTYQKGGGANTYPMLVSSCFEIFWNSMVNCTWLREIISNLMLNSLKVLQSTQKNLDFWVVSTRILSLQDVPTDHRLDAGKCSKGLYVESTLVEYSRPISSKRPNGTMPEGPPST